MSAASGVVPGDGLAGGVAMAAMAVGSVGLWTLRVAFAARGRKLLGAAVAAVEAVVFAVAFSSLSASLDSPVRVLGYALGVAAGTLLGLHADDRASRGKSEIHVVFRGDEGGLVESLRRQGWPATSFAADGPRGAVTVAFLAVHDAQVPHVVEALRQSAPDAFWTVQPLRRMHPSPSMPGAAPSRVRPTRTQEKSDDGHSSVLAARDHTA